MKEQIILMADIIGSGRVNQRQLMQDFKAIVQEVNISNKEDFLSPLTITLGDEFQGIAKGLKEAISIIFNIEEKIISAGKTFKLRYVTVEGIIETPINPEIAYGMMGNGLTKARALIENLKKSNHRFCFNLKDRQGQTALNNLFIALQNVVEGWSPEKDYYLVSSFLQLKDYKLVASALHKHPSLMWRRNKSLRIETYVALKEVANFMGEKINV